MDNTIHGETADAHLARFIEQVGQQFQADAIESFWRLQGAFRELLDSGAMRGLLNRELRTLLDNANHMGDWRPNQLMLHRGRGHALSIWLFEQPRRYIHSLPFHGMYAPLGGHSLHYDLYRLPPGYRNAQFDPTLRLEPAGSGITAPGGILLLRSDEYLYDFKIEQPQPVAKFTTAPYQTLEWLFERDGLRACQANDSELISTQLRVSAYVLGRLGNPASSEALRSLAGHDHHAVRWAALQNLARIDPAAAAEGLHDPHPHVRRAAAGSLRRLETTSTGAL